MSQYDTALAQYRKTFTEKLGRKDYDEQLLNAIAKSLGPSIYDKDAARVACSKKAERDLIKTNFLIKRLKLKDEPGLDEAIIEICQTMGSSNRNKYRAVFYYLLVEKYDKASLFAGAKEKAKSTTTPKTEKPKIEATKKATPKKVEVKGKTKSTESKKSTSTSEPTPKEQQKGPKKEKKTNYANDTQTLRDAEDIINKYALYAAGAGLVPIPLLDLASITAVQYNMIKHLAANYDHVSFDDKKTKTILASIVGGVSSFELGIIARVLFKGIPFFGPIIGGTAVSGFAYASTKAIGEIFDEHFASGGDLTIEELTAKKMRSSFNWNLKKYGKRK